MAKNTIKKEIYVTFSAFALIALLVLVIASNGIASGKPTKIKIAHTTAKETAVDLFAVAFKDYVEQHAPGEFAIKIHPNSVLGGQKDTTEQCMKGIIEMVFTPIGTMAVFEPTIGAFTLPYIFPDMVTAWRILNPDNLLMVELRKRLIERHGIRLLGIGTGANFRSFANTKRRIRTPADLKGLKIRTIKSDIQVHTTEALGAIPTPIAWGELYTALQTGVVDGTKNSIGDIVDMHFDEVIKYITLDNHSPLENFWFMNENFYQSVSKETQAVFNNAGRFATIVTKGVNYQIIRRNTKKWLDVGNDIYHPTSDEKKLFVKKVEPVYKWFGEKHGDFWLKRLRNAIDELKE